MTPHSGLRFMAAEAIQITRGRSFLPTDPENCNNDFDIDYIAHSLALQCRWMGGTTDLETGAPLFYSVAQHSCIVADLVQAARHRLLPDHLWGVQPGFYGLMHDASEAYLCDIPRPLKPLLPGYYEYEAALMKVILREFNVTTNAEIIKAVKIIDNYMIFWERDEMIGSPDALYYDEPAQHPNTSIYDVIPAFEAWDPARAKSEFLWRFDKLSANDSFIRLDYLHHHGNMKVAA